MFSLCYGLYKRYTAKQSFTLLILGLDGAGKTSFYKLARISNTLREEAQRLRAESQQRSGSKGESAANAMSSTSVSDMTARALQTMPTIGFNVGTVDLPDSRIQLTLWDLGGQVGLRPLWDHYYNDANALVFLVDAADQDRIYEVKRELSRLISEPQLSDAPIIILANKQDLPEALSVQDLAKQLDISLHGKPGSTNVSGQGTPTVTSSDMTVTVDLEGTTTDEDDETKSISVPTMTSRLSSSGAAAAATKSSEPQLKSSVTGYWPGTNRTVLVFPISCRAGIAGGIDDLLIYLRDVLPTLPRSLRLLSEKAERD